MRLNRMRVAGFVLGLGMVASGALGACGGDGASPAGPDPLGADSAVLLEDFSARTFFPANN